MKDVEIIQQHERIKLPKNILLRYNLYKEIILYQY
jgi:hypothetical protein